MPPAPTSRLLRGPPVPPGLCSGAPPTPRPRPPHPSWHSRAANVARGPGPQTGTPLPATLQGPLSALQGAAPLANRGQCVCAWGGGGRCYWLGLYVTEQGPSNVPASCAGAVLCGKVGAPLPVWLTSPPPPQAKAGAGGKDSRGESLSPTGEGTQHRASPHLQPGRTETPSPTPPPLYSAFPHLSPSPMSQLCLFLPAVSPPCPVVRSHSRLRAWPPTPAAGAAAHPQKPGPCAPDSISPHGTCPRLPSHDESLGHGWTLLHYSQLSFTCDRPHTWISSWSGETATPQRSPALPSSQLCSLQLLARCTVVPSHPDPPCPPTD